MRPMLRLLAGVLAIVACQLPAPARAENPAYDCHKASGTVAMLVCNDAQLAHLDVVLNGVYQRALHAADRVDALPDLAVRELKATQRGWLRGRDDCWKAPDVRRCVQDEYQFRISALEVKWQLVQPERTAQYRCDDGNDFTLNFYTTDGLPSVSVDSGHERVVYVQGTANDGTRYNGLFGRYVWLRGNDADYQPDAAAPDTHCTREDEKAVPAAPR